MTVEINAPLWDDKDEMNAYIQEMFKLGFDVKVINGDFHTILC